MRLKTFGSYNLQASGLYQTSYSDNFGDTVPRTVRLPGLSGGFDQYGSQRAPLEIGKVTLQLTIVATARTAMDALRRDIRALTMLGRRQLTRSVDFDADDQWCYARVNSVQIAQSERAHSDLWQEVSITWQVSDPGWRVALASPVVVAAGGVLTSQTVAYGGTQPTAPTITIAPGASATCQHPTVQRYVSGALVDQVAYTGTLTDTDALVIDCEALSVKLNGADAFANFTNRRAGWFELLAGDNDVRVTFANGGDAAQVSIQYDERWV